MKTVRRRTPAKPRRRVTLKPPSEPTAEKEERKPGQPNPTTWLPLEEKQRRAARLLARRPRHPGLDPQYDEPAKAAIKMAVELLQRDGWSLDGSDGTWTLYRVLEIASGDANVNWRTFHLIEDALERLFPENVTRAGRTLGVMWLQDRHAKSADEVIRVLEDVLTH